MDDENTTKFLDLLSNVLTFMSTHDPDKAAEMADKLDGVVDPDKVRQIKNMTETRIAANEKQKFDEYKLR